MRIYLAGAAGYAPTCRQVKGKDMGLLCSYYGVSKPGLRKMIKILKNNRKEELKNERNGK